MKLSPGIAIELTIIALTMSFLSDFRFVAFDAIDELSTHARL